MAADVLPPFCPYHQGELLHLYAVLAPTGTEDLIALYTCPSIGGEVERRYIDLAEEAELYLEAATGSDGPVVA